LDNLINLHHIEEYKKNVEESKAAQKITEKSTEKTKELMKSKLKRE
jgi:hypothetical protein